MRSTLTFFLEWLINAFPDLKSLKVKFDLYIPHVIVKDLNTTMKDIKLKQANVNMDILYHTLEDVAPCIGRIILRARYQCMHSSRCCP